MSTFFKIIIKSLFRNRLISIISIVSMTFGLATVMFIFMWVYHELSYDRFYKNSSSIFRVNTEIKGKGISPFSVDNVAPVLKEKYPEVVSSCRVEVPTDKQILIKYENKEFIEPEPASADSNFVDFFSYEVIHGQLKDILTSRNQIVINESLAKKLFGSTDPIGKILTLITRRQRQVVVSGVIKDIPENSHLKFNSVVLLTGIPYWGNGWEYTNASTYVRLVQNVPSVEFEKKIANLIKQHDPKTVFRLHLQPIREIHLFSQKLIENNPSVPLGDIRYIYIFSAIAVFILVIAVINFVNLSIASSIKRANEIIIKKVIGIKKFQIIRQFIGESTLFVFIALLLSVIIVNALLPAFNSLTGKQMFINFFDYRIISVLLTLTLILGVLSGFYPAISISSYNSSSILKGSFQGTPKGLSLTKILVTLQFVISIVLIISTAIVQRQLGFIQDKKLGLNKDQIIYFNGHDLPLDPKESLLKLAAVSNVTWTSDIPLSVNDFLDDAGWTEKKSSEKIKLNYIRADEDFIKTFNLQLSEGRNFSKNIASDSFAVILNETAVKQLNIQQPIGKEFICEWGVKAKSSGKIIGIVKDFHFNSLHSSIKPLVISQHVGKPWYIFVRIDSKDITSLKEIDKVIKNICPNCVVNYSFLDQFFEHQYISEKRTATLCGFFCSITIAISCLGLFGLTVFSTDRRVKEISIRRVNGAKISEIMIMLNSGILSWVFGAFIIASPIALYIMNKWLQDFAYKAALSWWIFAAAGLLTLIIAMLTVSWQSWRAATRNPVESLRYE